MTDGAGSDPALLSNCSNKCLLHQCEVDNDATIICECMRLL